MLQTGQMPLQELAALRQQEQEQIQQPAAPNAAGQAGSCTCGRCIGGVLSVRAASWMAVAAQEER